MSNGGQQVLDLINGVTQQTEANRELGKEVSEGVIAVGANGGVAYNDPKDLQRALSTADANLIGQEVERNVIQPAADAWQAFSRNPSQFLPSFDYDPRTALNWIINPDNHKSEE
jgi:hypothetical protein